MSSLPDRFTHHVLSTDLFARDARILIGVSGGVDSVVLLDLVATRFPDATIAVAHFDHGWRDESAEDARWVGELARSWNAECLAGAGTPTSHTETSARTSRYGFFHSAAEAWRADVFLTAHHADDQAETVLFRLARGAGTRGLRGIPARRGMITRPLLPIRRAEIRHYADARGLTWREDKSNLDTRHARNRIRHLLLPALEQRSPGITDQLLRIAALAEESEKHWRTELANILAEVVIGSAETDGERGVESGFTLATGVLRGYHPSIRARVLRTLSRRLGIPLRRSGTHLGSEFINTSRSGSFVCPAPGLRLEREFDRLILRRDAKSDLKSDVNACAIPTAARADCAVIDNAHDGVADVTIGGRRFRIRWTVDVRDGAGDATHTDVAFNSSQLRFPLELRGWRAGDRIRLAGGSKKLKKLFVERRVGRSTRECVPLLAEQGTGTVLWMAGIARATVADPVIGTPTFRIRIEE
jgi:tRNA(Ile)-lysidine synthetase-like protein